MREGGREGEREGGREGEKRIEGGDREGEGRGREALPIQDDSTYRHY